ncbi:MAG: DNA translocase FtsK, partial [Dehalococcoidia bacterium]|nr:DNA translocase FtsK [Dehalococcoidia bacterium]
MMKASEDGTAGRKARGFPWRALGRLLFGNLRRTLTILLILVVLIVWQAATNAAFYRSAGDRIIETLGWGILLVGLGFGALVWVVWRRRLMSLFRHGNRWLGALALWLAAYGILGFFNADHGLLLKASLGGTFGRDIVLGSADVWGGLRVFGLLLGGFILIFPSQASVLGTKIGRALARLYRKHPVHGSFAAWFRLLIGKAQRFLGRVAAGISGIFASPEPVAAKSKPKAERAKPAAVPPAARAPAPAATAPPAALVVPSSNRVSGRWALPPMSVLDPETTFEFGQADSQKRAKLIEQALASYGVDASVVQINPGPSVTQYGIEPGWDRKFRDVREKGPNGKIKLDKNGAPVKHKEEVSKTRVKVERITSLANDLALALATPSIRIEAPVPGKSVIGIEVPNAVTSLVTVRGVIESAAFQKLQTKCKLAVGLGKATGGEVVVADIAKMPHLLIAGATGSGKTACMNSIIGCLLMQNT